MHLRCSQQEATREVGSSRAQSAMDGFAAPSYIVQCSDQSAIILLSQCLLKESSYSFKQPLQKGCWCIVGEKWSKLEARWRHACSVLLSRTSYHLISLDQNTSCASILHTSGM